MDAGPVRVIRTIIRVAGLTWLAGALLVAAMPVHGYRTAAGTSPPPAMFQDACPGNLLANPSFEEGSRKTEDIGTSLSSSVGNGWFPWFIRGDQQYNREPEFKVEDATRDPLRWRVHSGYFSQKFFTTWATHTAGVYQQVPARPGSVVNLTAWVQIYTGEADGWDGQKHTSDPNAPGNYRAYIGIDPFGNTPPGAGAPPPNTVIWTEPLMTYDVWTPLTVQAVAQADHVTVYTRGQPEFGVKHNDSFWDTACLTVGGVARGIGIPAGADAVVNTALLNFRAGPGTEYDIIGTLRQGDPLTVEARLADNSWLQVTNDAGVTGWVFTDLVRLGIELGDVPVALETPPAPTLIPTETLEPSPTPDPTATSIPTDTPAPTATPEPTQTPVPAVTIIVVTATPEAVARVVEPGPVAGGGQDAPAPAPQAQPQQTGAPGGLSCGPALIAASLGTLGIVLWSRRRGRKD